MKKIHTINKPFYLLILLYLFTSCIEQYIPDKTNNEKLIVVDALITDDKEEQTITLSWSTLLAAPIWDPIANANIVVIDKGNNIFEFFESKSERGVYKGSIPFEFLVPGNAFKISFTTLDGKEYESNFEELLTCPEVDSVYYEVNNDYYNKSNNSLERGVEFFIDVKADDNFSRYYRWKIDEAYEYHATWPIQKYWLAEWYNLKSPDYKYYVCYKDQQINSIYTATTSHLDENVYLKFPLNFVNNQTQRLYFNYSILVKQMSITEKSHYYWESLKNNNQNSGGLFDSQPVKVKGNIICLSNTDEVALGYFGVASIKTKRILVTMDYIEKELIFDYDPFCTSRKIETQNAGFILDSPREKWPIYVAPTPAGEPDGIYYANQECFDCRLAGGKLEAPEFWKTK